MLKDAPPRPSLRLGRGFQFYSVVLLSMLGFALLTSCTAPNATGVAPFFSAQSSQGKSVKLSDYKGKVILLNFWATWCDSCIEELPTLKKLYNAHNKSFELLALSVDDSPQQVVPPFAIKNNIAFPILYADNKISEDYGIRMLPTSYLISPEGTIARRYVGPLDFETVQNDILSLITRR